MGPLTKVCTIMFDMSILQNFSDFVVFVSHISVPVLAWPHLAAQVGEATGRRQGADEAVHIQVDRLAFKTRNLRNAHEF